MKKSVLVIILTVITLLILLGVGCKFDADSIASTVFNEQNNNDQENSVEETTKGEELVLHSTNSFPLAEYQRTENPPYRDRH